MNYIILYASSVLLKIRVKKWNLIASACLGAVYTVIMYLNIINLYSNFFMKFLLSIAIVYIAFKPKKFKLLLKELIIFYLTSFVFGGCVFALMYFAKPQLVQIRNGAFVGVYPLKVAIVGGVISFIIIQLGFRLVKSKVSKRDVIFKLKIYFFEKVANVTALLDTGNLLKEPITGNIVIIVEKGALSKVLPKEILNNIDKIIGGDTNELINDSELSKYVSRFRIIPFSSVGKQNGLLLGIKCDGVDIVTDETIESRKNVIVGIYDKAFTKNGLYSAIFGLDLFEGGNVNESVSNVKV